MDFVAIYNEKREIALFLYLLVIATAACVGR